jgi:hypothetical protein
MKVYYIYGIVLCSLLLIESFNCKNVEPELKMEYIKKKEDCDMRSKNGDILHV